jgi:hypothetical protein
MNVRSENAGRRRRIAFGTAGLLFAAAISSFAVDKDTIVWKSFDNAIVRIDDAAPKIWNLYHTGKKADPLLLQLGTRSLVVYIHDQAVYELQPAQLQRRGLDLVWRESDRPEKPMPSSDWSTRDVGSAWRVRFTLKEEGRMFDIQIPQMPDLRGLY